MKETEFEEYFQRPCQYCGECPIWLASEKDPSLECEQAVKNGTCNCFGMYVGFDELGNNDVMKKKYIVLLNKHYLLDETVKFVPEIHAHWYKDKISKLHKCSNCHKYATYGFAMARVWDQCLSKYCPFCGAIMDEEKN